MKLTIIREDKTVYKNGVSYSNLDMSSVPTSVHALQWVEDKGWIEFVQDVDFKKPDNETLTQLPTWANTCAALWEQAKALEEAAIATALELEAAQNLMAQTSSAS